MTDRKAKITQLVQAIDIYTDQHRDRIAKQRWPAFVKLQKLADELKEGMES